MQNAPHDEPWAARVDIGTLLEQIPSCLSCAADYRKNILEYLLAWQNKKSYQ